MRRFRGFSLLELMVAAVLIGIVVTVLLDRLLYYQEAAEKASMDYTVRTIESALRMRMATLLIEGRTQEYASLARENPMDWLSEKPGNYAGQFKGPDIDRIPAGDWYFDLGSHTLIYLIKRGDHFESGISGPKRVRFRVSLIRNPPEGMEVDQPVAGVTLRLVEPYRWF